MLWSAGPPGTYQLLLEGHLAQCLCMPLLGACSLLIPFSSAIASPYRTENMCWRFVGKGEGEVIDIEDGVRVLKLLRTALLTFAVQRSLSSSA